MSYRPICDVWLLGRPKVPYYGAYPNGFLQRARVLIGCSYTDRVLHVCSGKVEDYPNKGFGPHDITLDIDANLKPDLVLDAEEQIPESDGGWNWDGILADLPYTQKDANNYSYKTLPNPNKVLKNCINAVDIGKKVGFLHYICPSPPKNAKFIACVGVLVGFNNRMRCFSVYERIA